MPPSRSRKASFATLTTIGALLLIECCSSAAEWTVLYRTIPSPSPNNMGGADWDGAFDAEQMTRWGGRVDAPYRGQDEDPPQGTHFILKEDAAKGWRLPRNHDGVTLGVRYRINRDGMRGGPLQRRAPGQARLLTIGDSSIFGDTVPEEDVFSEIAAAQLSERWGCEVVGLNGGVPGYTSAQALIWLRELWASADPDVVVMGTMWSDVYPEGGRPQTDRVLREPLRRMATYRVLRTLLVPWLSPQKVRWINSQEDFVSDDADAAVALPAYIDNLRQAAAFAQERGAAMAFLALPAPVDLDRAPVPEVIQDYRAAMAMVAAETGSPLVDGPAWLAQEEGSLALFNDNVHPSSAGHALIGYAVAQTLGERPAPCR